MSAPDDLARVIQDLARLANVPPAEMQARLAAMKPEALAALLAKLSPEMRGGLVNLGLVKPLVGPGKWIPNPGPQTLAYNSLADCTLYGGEPGGGKSQLGLGLA